jgi:chromosome segregation ATPase
MEKFLKELKERIYRSKTWMEDPNTEPDTKLYHEGKIEAYELALNFLEHRSATRGPAIKMISDAMKILDGDHDVEEAFARYERKFEEFEDEIAGYVEEFEVLDQEFGALESTLTGRNDRIKFLESELARKDCKIETLLERGDNDYQHIQSLAAVRDELEFMIEDRDETIENQLTRESELRAELETKEKSIQHLSNIVKYISDEPISPDYPWRVILNHPPGEINVAPTPKVEMILDFIDDDPSSPDHRGVWKPLETEKPKRRRFKFGMRR